MVFYVPRMFGELPVTWYLTNCLKELSFAHPLEERRLICAIPILHPEKHTSIWIAVGEELRYMSLLTGKSCLNAMLSLEDVMINVGRMEI